MWAIAYLLCFHSLMILSFLFMFMSFIWGHFLLFHFPNFMHHNFFIHLFILKIAFKDIDFYFYDSFIMIIHFQLPKIRWCYYGFYFVCMFSTKNILNLDSTINAKVLQIILKDPITLFFLIVKWNIIKITKFQFIPLSNPMFYQSLLMVEKITYNFLNDCLGISLHI